MIKTMKLSIITINRNNAAGLEKTLKSVAAQTCKDFEHIIIDGASTDDSVGIIKRYVENTTNPSPITNNPSPVTHHQIKWISEPDKGIYNAMNKGIRMAEGEYIQILNSGDILASCDVVAGMRIELMTRNSALEEPLPILYGNMIKDFGNGKQKKDTCGNKEYTPESFLYFYNGTLNHDSAYIRRDLFEKYGYYNEQLKICSDWEWYVRAIVLGKEKVYYANIDVTIFDMFGVSESNGENKDVIKKERREYLESIMLPSVLHDYDIYSKPIFQYKRLKKHHLWPLVTFVERVLFKFEKWGILK